jgi:hypothetical protein
VNRDGRRTPRVTVLMTVFNGERHLGEAVDSVLGQSFDDFELLIVDDASTDGTSAILGALTDPRVRVVPNAQNLGLTRSLNRGLALARGDLIARHDADDVSEPERLARQVAFLDAHPDAALVGSCYRKIDDSGAPLGDRALPLDHDRIRWALHFYCPFIHSAVVFRADVIQALGGYDETFVYAQDYDLWSRVAAAHRVANLAEMLVRYRIGAATLTATIGEQSGEVPRVAARNIEALGVAAPSVSEHLAMGALLRGDAGTMASTEFVSALDGVLGLLDRLCARDHGLLVEPEALVNEIARALARTIERRAGQLSGAEYRGSVERLRLTAPSIADALSSSRHVAALRGKLDWPATTRALPSKP